MPAAVADSPLPSPAAAQTPTPPERRFPTPTLLQMEAVECGAACLGILLSHYGCYVPLEQLRLDCGVSRDGSKASNLLRAARRHGFNAEGSKQEVELLYEIQRPLIIFWNFNHFLVLEGFHKGRAYINDPASGPRSISLEELDAAFTGVVLELEPGPDFQRTGEPPSLWPALLRRLSRSRSAFAYVAFCTLLLVVPGLVVPTFSRIFVDEYLVRGHSDWVRPLLLGMGLTAAARMIIAYLREYYLLKFETKLALTSSSHFLGHVLRLPIEFFSQRYGGEIGSRVQINDKVANVLAAKLGPTALDLLLVVFYALLMFRYDVWLTLACIALALVNVVAMRSLGRVRVDGSRRLLQERGKLTGTAMGGLQMIETLKATGGESDFFARWAGYQAKTLRAQQKLALYTQGLSAVPTLLNTVTTTVILGLGGLRVMDGYLTMGMLVAFQSLMSSFTRPIGNLVSFGSAFQELEGDMNRLDDVLRYPQDPRFVRATERRRVAAVAASSSRPALDTALERPPGESAEAAIKNTVQGFFRRAGEFISTVTASDQGADHEHDAIFQKNGAGGNHDNPPADAGRNGADHPRADAAGVVGLNGNGQHQNGAGPAATNGSEPPPRPLADLRVPKLTGHVELRDVSFGYSPLDKPLIEGFNLVIKPGQRVALIGGSGSGKSTVAKLVAGLYRPRSGQILFDGAPREDIPNRLLSTSIGAVDQEVFFFQGTIRENLTIWDATIPETDITAAIRDACISDVINSRPQGILSPVAEGGANFSGGQRQRLEIARALVVRPSFLILDEATSALDPATERQIDENLRRLGCSCLIVAHRLSTIRDCDEIIIMERGRIVQRGTHDEMKEIEGPYATLISQH